jgi:hypothetical protein
VVSFFSFSRPHVELESSPTAPSASAAED